MRILLLILLMLLEVSTKEKTLIVTQKVIQVSGQTSLGGFTCDYTNVGVKDTLFLGFSHQVRDLVFDIPVGDFSCGNFLLNRDFRKTIQADQYPKATVRVRNMQSNYGYYTCDLMVEMVGKRLNFRDFVLQREADGLRAELVLSFGELDLKAPSRMGGIVKVEEQLGLSIFLGF